MLNIDASNRYFLRLLPLGERQDLVGQVVYLRMVSGNGLIVSKTDDCRPAPELIRLTPAANDEGWYDATELIFAANCAITPRYDLCIFACDTAKQYRNHIDEKEALRVYDIKSAVGRLCFLGRQVTAGVELSATAHFVVFTDDHGFSVTYSGFCNPKSKKRGSFPKLTQRILRLEGTGQVFVDAPKVVEFCNTAYSKDVQLKDNYVQAIRDRVATSATTTAYAEYHRKQTEGLSGLNLS